MFLNIIIFMYLFCVFVVYLVYSVFCVLFLLLCSLFPVLVQFYRPLPPAGNPVTVNKYHITYQLLRTVVNTLPEICERYILNTCNDVQ